MASRALFLSESDHLLYNCLKQPFLHLSVRPASLHFGLRFLTAGFIGPGAPLVKCNTSDPRFAGCAVPLRSCSLRLPHIMTPVRILWKDLA